jgi:hypothetical protein
MSAEGAASSSRHGCGRDAAALAVRLAGAVALIAGGAKFDATDRPAQQLSQTAEGGECLEPDARVSESLGRASSVRLAGSFRRP